MSFVIIQNRGGLLAVSFNNPNKRDYKNSSKGFNDYMDRLNQLHPDKKVEMGEAYNYGMQTSVHAMRDQHRAMMHKQLDDIKQEQKKQLRNIREEQKRLRKGKPDGFI